MGNDPTHSPSQSFKKQDWELIDSQDNYSVWKNRSDPTESIVEHSIYSSNDVEEGEERQMFVLRKNHPTIVAARYLITESSAQFCSSTHHQKLFIEKIPIRLSDIEQVPFPDYLHIYSQCLKGFQELSRHIGCFPIEEEYIGINEKGVIKVWMNQNFFKNYHNGRKVSEEFMVKNTIQIIQKNINHSLTPREVPSVRNYLYRNKDRLSFEEANREFTDLLNRYFAGKAPSRLDCIDNVGGVDAIANRQGLSQQARHHKALTNQSPYNSTMQEQYEHQLRTNQRPQLIDSQILKDQFPISSPRIQSSPIFYQAPQGQKLRLVNGSQFIPNMQKNILSPSTVKENTPIVRKQASTFHNIAPVNAFNPNGTQPLQQQNSGKQIYLPPNRGSNIQIQPTSPQINYKLNQRIESKSFGGKTVPIIYRQQPLVNSQMGIPSLPPPSNSNPLIVGKTSLIQLVQPQTPKYNEQTSKQISFAPQNKAFFKEPTNADQNLPKYQAQLQRPQPYSYNNNNPSSFLFERPSSKSLTEKTEKRLSSCVIASGNFEPFAKNPNPFPFHQRVSSSIHQIQPQVVPPQVQIPKMGIQLKNNQPFGSNIKNQFNFLPYENTFKTNASDSALKYNAQENIYLPKSTGKTSQYTTVDIDDGKSSSDFLKKLKQIGNFDANLRQQTKQSQPSYKQSSPFQYKYDFSLPNQERYVRSPQLKEVNSLQNINQSQEALSTQQFGRNAVSNIISNQSGIQIASQKYTNNTPLKFEKNLDMKYSMFKADQPPSPTYETNYVYKKYEPNFDAEIWADMNKLKS